ncbi:MAG: PLP-dependent aminotransferase family protein, partial [Dorea sp.]
DICTISGEHAGVHLLLTFYNGMKEEELLSRAKEKDICIYGLSDYCIHETEEKATVLLGYANLSEEKIKEAVSLLNQCLR